MEAEKWLEKAEKDMDDAKFNFMHERFEVAAFLAHQAAEKALKSLYIKKFKRLWKIHDLTRLAQKVNAPKKVIIACDSLNPHYIETRYPLDVTYTRDMTEEAIDCASLVIEWVKKRLKKG